jgi:hypothetical protein
MYSKHNPNVDLSSGGLTRRLSRGHARQTRLSTIHNRIKIKVRQWQDSNWHPVSMLSAAMLPTFKRFWSRGSSVSIVTRLRAGRPGSTGRRGGEGIFISPPSRGDRFWANAASYPTITVALSPGVKRPGSNAVHSPPSRAEVKNAWTRVLLERYKHNTLKTYSSHTSNRR